jgi:hypothetical protein
MAVTRGWGSGTWGEVDEQVLSYHQTGAGSPGVPLGSGVTAGNNDVFKKLEERILSAFTIKK